MKRERGQMLQFSQYVVVENFGYNAAADVTNTKMMSTSYGFNPSYWSFGYSKKARIVGIQAAMEWIMSEDDYTGANALPDMSDWFVSFDLLDQGSGSLRFKTGEFVKSGSFTPRILDNRSMDNMLTVTREMPYLDIEGMGVYSQGVTGVFSQINFSDLVPPLQGTDAAYNHALRFSVWVDPSDMI